MNYNNSSLNLRLDQLVYALTVTNKTATYALMRFRILNLWCIRMQLWAFLSDQRAVNWDRSHTLYNTIVSIGNLAGKFACKKRNLFGSTRT